MQHREEGFCGLWSRWNQCSTNDVTVLKVQVNLFMLVVFIILIYSCQRCLSYKLATRWARTSMSNIPDASHEHYFHRPTSGKGRAGASSLSYRYSVQCDQRLTERFLKSLILDFISIRTFPNVPYRSCPCRSFPTITLLSKKVVSVFDKRQYLYTWLSLESGHGLFENY